LEKKNQLHWNEGNEEWNYHIRQLDTLIVDHFNEIIRRGYLRDDIPAYSLLNPTLELWGDDSKVCNRPLVMTTVSFR